MTHVFATLGVVMACGVLYRRLPGVPDAQQVRGVIGSMVLNIFVPLLTFGVLATAPIGSELWTVPLVSVTTVIVGFIASWVIYARVLRRWLSPPAIGSLILATTWCNAMYLGLPITTAVVGTAMSRIPILYDYLGMTPLLFTLGTVVCVEYGTRGQRHTIVEGLLQAAKMPPTIAVVAGVGVNLVGIAVPSWFLEACTTAGRVVAPLMLFSIGLALRLPSLRSIPLIAPSVLLRCILIPLIILPLAQAVMHDPSVLRSAMLETAMPTMMLTMVFADRYGLDEAVLAQAILLSTLVAVATIPLVAQWPL